MDQQHLHLGAAVLTQQSNDKAANTTWLPTALPHGSTHVRSKAGEDYTADHPKEKEKPRSVHWLLVSEVLGQGEDQHSSEQLPNLTCRRHSELSTTQFSRASNREIQVLLSEEFNTITCSEFLL